MGSGAGSNVTNANDVICIGIAGANVDNSCFIGHIIECNPLSGRVAGFSHIQNGRLGTMTYPRTDLKHDINPMEKTSEALFALKPVSFRYNKEIDPRRHLHFGLIAEDVAAVNPDLVVRDKDGKARIACATTR